MAPTTVNPGIGITGIGQISVNIYDLERATAFYRDALGLPLLFQTGDMSFFDCGGIRLMLTKAERPEFDHPGSILYLKVPDIQAAHRKLQECGAHFESQPAMIARMPTHDLWIAAFRDTEKNYLSLMSEVARSE
jgi:methylmalonyl-CoA/ethylmalonyl-CoA epimerase